MNSCCNTCWTKNYPGCLNRGCACHTPGHPSAEAALIDPVERFIPDDAPVRQGEQNRCPRHFYEIEGPCICPPVATAPTPEPAPEYPYCPKCQGPCRRASKHQDYWLTTKVAEPASPICPIHGGHRLASNAVYCCAKIHPIEPAPVAPDERAAFVTWWRSNKSQHFDQTGLLRETSFDAFRAGIAHGREAERKCAAGK